MAASNYTAEAHAKLAELAASFYDDPYGFVMAAYPWGEPTLADGSPNPLKNKKGPEPWQKRLLIKVGEHIKENGELKSLDLDYLVWRSARASGHGIGKSAIVAWLIQFFMATRKDTRGVVTANTQKQLEDKTWPELAKWHNMFLWKDWFEWSATAYTFRLYPEERRKNYRCTAATVSEENTEAFAGLHNEGGTVFVIFDEASGIVPKIWEVAQGALTDGEGFFFAFGNPTRPDGEFADCFDKYAHMYDLEHIDSREVSHTNKQHIRDLIRMYGEDSDEVKVRVKGQFPNQAFNGFIGIDTVVDAVEREYEYDPGAAIIMSIDVARFGDDETVFAWRQGRDARTRPMVSYKGLKTTKITQIAIEYANKIKPDIIVIESTGPGAGVIDQLRDAGFKVHEVHPGAPASESEHYFNRRAEIWSKMRDWLINEGCLMEDPALTKQLTAILYTLDRHEQRIKLEPKEEYKKRTGLGSPDRADALALTFAVKIARRDTRLTRAVNIRDTAEHEYDPIMH